MGCRRIRETRGALLFPTSTSSLEALISYRPDLGLAPSELVGWRDVADRAVQARLKAVDHVGEEVIKIRETGRLAA